MSTVPLAGDSPASDLRPDRMTRPIATGRSIRGSSSMRPPGRDAGPEVRYVPASRETSKLIVPSCDVCPA